MEKANTAPTGCYKCGRPGHWSRDCPDSNPNSNSTTHLSNSNSSRSFPFRQPSSNSNNNSSSSKVVAEKPKKVPRSRPKLTPELLVGDDDGLGFVLRHFPRNFKYRGHGHEVLFIAFICLYIIMSKFGIISIYLCICRLAI